jgi:hypothetical protein
MPVSKIKPSIKETARKIKPSNNQTNRTRTIINIMRRMNPFSRKAKKIAVKPPSKNNNDDFSNIYTTPNMLNGGRTIKNRNKTRRHK